MAHSRDFSGKIALVTGSSSGIGEEIVIQLSKYGAQVIVTGRGQGKIDAVVEKCNKVSPKNLKALGIKCDVTKDEDVHALFNKTISSFSGLDILVNNAGIATFASITEITMEQFDSTMRADLRAPFLITHLFAPHLIKSKGNIVNVSSIAGLHPHDNGAIYCSMKAGFDMFTKCLSIDLGPKGVRVNSVNPALIRTPIFSTLGMDSEMFVAMEQKSAMDYPLGRIGEVDEVAKLVLFLASNDASFITGLVAQIDGGSLHNRSGKGPSFPKAGPSAQA